MRGDYQPFGPPPRRRWGVVSWWYSLILAVPVVILGAILLVQQFSGPSGLRGSVVDAYTGDPVSGAQVVSGQQQTETDRRGHFSVGSPAATVEVTKTGYEPTTVPVPTAPGNLRVTLRPNVVTGVVRSRVDEAPIAGASVVARVGEAVAGSATTDAEGAFRLEDVPADATLAISADAFAGTTLPVGQLTSVQVTLRPDVVTGTVRDARGQPVAGVTVAAGTGRATTGADGTYRLSGAPESGQVVFKRAGYRAATAPLDDTMRADARLEPFDAKAVYVTADTVANEAAFAALIDIVDRTELNAMVVDLKDSSGLVFYDTQVQLAHDIDAVHPMFDPRAVVERLHQRGIYVIARIVVFEDPVLAEARPDWAIHTADGGLWRTWNGLAWVNAHRPEVWAYDTALASEAASLGFDEIQLDYIRFPSDGDLDQAEYGVEHNKETRPAAIRDFLGGVRDALAPTTAYLGVDVFGLTLWELGDSGIGQHLEDFAPLVDIICPMVYPSHFYTGSMGFDVPNDHPYEVILWSLENGAERVPDEAHKFRPWLQDFSYGVGIEYTDHEVRRQIDASDDFGASGWMLWNAANVYHQGALRAE